MKSRDFVRRYLFRPTARWRHRLDRLRKQWLVTPRCSVVNCFWCSLNDCLHRLLSWCPIGHFQFDYLEPIVPLPHSSLSLSYSAFESTLNSAIVSYRIIVGPSSLWVGIIMIVHANRCRLESVRLRKTSSACKSLFFIIRTIARTSRLSSSLQHIVIVYFLLWRQPQFFFSDVAEG